MKAAWVLAALIVTTVDGQSGAPWRDRFDVNKADLLPAGNNPYITMQPGRVLRLAHGKDYVPGIGLIKDDDFELVTRQP